MSDSKTHTALTAATSSVGTAAKARWCRATLTSLAAVEELLDHLERAGFGERRVSVADDAFAVWWR